MYKLNKFYSEPQNKTTVQLEYQSVDTSDYEYYVKVIDGDLRDVPDEDVTKMVLDTVRIKLNPNEAVTSLDNKMKELDEAIQRSDQHFTFTQMGMMELMETVYVLVESVMGLQMTIEGVQATVEELQNPNTPNEPDEPEIPVDPNAPGEGDPDEPSPPEPNNPDYSEPDEDYPDGLEDDIPNPELPPEDEGEGE